MNEVGKGREEGVLLLLFQLSAIASRKGLDEIGLEPRFVSAPRHESTNLAGRVAKPIAGR